MVYNIWDLLQELLQDVPEPMSVRLVQEFGRNPFIALMSCLISLRARDTATYPICQKLFQAIRTPQDMLDIKRADLEKVLYSVGFYRQKAKILQEVSKDLIDRFGGQVPSNLQDLLSIRHIGIKTAALVQAEGFDIPAICVDVHVHRLSNRLGLVQTKTPEETQKVLEKTVPRARWRDVNRLLVKLGQSACAPNSPLCVRCPIIFQGWHVGLKPIS